MAKAGKTMRLRAARRRDDKEVSLKKLAAAAGAKDAAMLPPAEAERITGYQVGGIFAVRPEEARERLHRRGRARAPNRDRQWRPARPADRDRARAISCALLDAKRRQLVLSARPPDRVRFRALCGASCSPGASPGSRFITRSASSRRKSRSCGASCSPARHARVRRVRGDRLRYRLRDHACSPARSMLFSLNFLLFYYGGDAAVRPALGRVLARVDHQRRGSARSCSARRSTGAVTVGLLGRGMLCPHCLPV